MKRFSITNLGQLKKADVTFGDLTLLVGPQASGKSVFLEAVKLALDHGDVVRTIKRHGFDWQGERSNYLELYFGEGMGQLWGQYTRMKVDTEAVGINDLMDGGGGKEKLFYIPAQRVLTLENGWPKAYTSFEPGDPYVVRKFSEHLRLLMQQGLGSKQSAVFPQQGRLKQALRTALDESVFHGATVDLDTSSMRKRIVLTLGEQKLPFMTWSAGQREFMPLLLGLYWLMPSGRAPRKPGIDWVVIEEPEMGLHPRAIGALLLIFLELVHRGYRVLISTHSPMLLEAAWAIQTLKDTGGGGEQLAQLFGLPKSGATHAMFDDLLREKTLRTYYFSPQEDGAGVVAEDISSLDPGAVNDDIADWGGLTSFSSRASEVISDWVANHTEQGTFDGM